MGNKSWKGTEERDSQSVSQSDCQRGAYKCLANGPLILLALAVARVQQYVYCFDSSWSRSGSCAAAFV